MAYTIFIQRKWQTPSSTVSEFAISGTDIKGYFLECPGPDTVMPNLKKRIPEGSYSLIWHNSGRFKKHSPTPLLFNAQVPSSRLILIHPGNKPQDTEGCLLPGTNRNIDEVTKSVILYDKLKHLMIEKGIHNFKVFIMSCYVDHGNRTCR